MTESENTQLLEKDPNELETKSEKAFERSLTLKYCFVMVVGCLIGSGLFISPALVARRTPNSFIASVVWILSGIVSLIGSLCYCELVSVFRKTGSTYIFVHETYGRYFSLPLLYSIIFIVIPFGYSAVLINASTYACSPFFKDTSSNEFYWIVRILSAALFLVIGIIGCLGARHSAQVQAFINGVIILSVVLLMIAAVYNIIEAGEFENIQPSIFFNGTIKGLEEGYTDIGLSMFSALFAFDGWYVVASFVEEIKNPRRNLPLLAFSGIPFVTLIFFIVNFSCLALLDHKEMGESDIIFVDAFKKIHISSAEYVMPIVVCIGSMSTIIGALYYQSRYILSAAREEQLPKLLSLMHNERETPVPAIFLIAILTTAAIFTGLNVEVTIQVYNAALWCEYLLAFTTLVYLRYKKPEVERSYRVWLSTAIFMCLTSLVLVCILFYELPWVVGLFVVMVACSTLVNTFFTGNQRLIRCFNLERICNWLVKRTNLVVNKFDEEEWNK